MIFAVVTDTTEISIATINVNYTRIPHTRGAFVDSHSISLAECLGAPSRYTDSVALSMQKDPNRLRARTIEKSSHCSQLSRRLQPRDSFHGILYARREPLISQVFRFRRRFSPDMSCARCNVDGYVIFGGYPETTDV